MLDDAATKFAHELLAIHQPLTQPDAVCLCRLPPFHRRPATLCSCGSYYTVCHAASAGWAVGLLPSPGWDDRIHVPGQRPATPSFRGDSYEEQLSEFTRRILGDHHAAYDEFPTCPTCGRSQYQRTYCSCTGFAARCDYARLARAHELQPPLPEERLP